DLVGLVGLHRVNDLDVNRTLIRIAAGGVVGAAGLLVTRRLGHEDLGEFGDGNLTGAAAQLVRLSTAVDTGDIERAPIRPRFRGGRAAFRYILDARSSLLCRFGGDPCVRARYTIGNAGRDGRKAGARLAVFPRSADDRRPDLRAGCFPLVDGPAG